MSTQVATSLTNMYADPSSPYSGFRQEHRSGGSMPVTLVRADHPAHENIDPAFEDVALIMSLRSDMPFQWNLGDGWTTPVRIKTGDITFVPANTSIAYRCPDAHEVLNITLSSCKISELLDQHRAGSLASFDPLA